MSDGPHKSLPLRPHWRTFAQRAAKAAFRPDEVGEALAYAIKRDVLQAPIKNIQEIMISETLFPSIRIEKLEALRNRHPGSTSAQLLIDCAITVSKDFTPELSTHTAIAMAIEGTVRNATRSIEEHYLREAHPNSSRFVQERQQAARRRLDCNALVKELLSAADPLPRREVRLPVYNGLDQGPQR